MAGESEAETRRKRIDPLLAAAGRKVVRHDPEVPRARLTHHAVTEYPTAEGPADYALWVGGRIVGIVEAKRVSRDSQPSPDSWKRTPLVSRPSASFLIILKTGVPTPWSSCETAFRLPRSDSPSTTYNGPTSCTTIRPLWRSSPWSSTPQGSREQEPLYTAEERVTWAFTQITAGRTFTAEQQQWLDRIRAHREFAICDPACGTGGFLVAAYEWLIQETHGGAVDRELAKGIKAQTYFGQDLVPRPRRLALMNLYLHGLEPQIRLGDSIYEVPEGRRYDVVLTNPPFGTKGAHQAPEREDFTIATSNKQLNFLQHVLTILRPGGRAAVVVPDNCLFADQAGEVFKILTEDCDLHTVLRLPNGTFTPYSPGTKTNVVFFTKGYATETVWVYDARTNVPRITKKDRPLTEQHFGEFEACFGADPNGRAIRTALRRGLLQRDGDRLRKAR